MKCFESRYRRTYLAGIALFGSAWALQASATDYRCAMTLVGLTGLASGEGKSPGEAYCAIKLSRDRSGAPPSCDAAKMDRTGLCQPRLPDPVIAEARRGGSDTATGPRRAYRCRLPMGQWNRETEQPWVLVEGSSFRDIINSAYAAGGYRATPQRELCMHAETFDALMQAIEKQSR